MHRTYKLVLLQNKEMPKIILHLDMDAFFCACEEKVNPSLKGKAVVVGADPQNGNGRGVVSTCSYEGRKYGIHSAMPISQAYKLNPKAIFLKPNFQLYSQISKRIMKILRNYSERIQQISIDEAYLDISEKANNFNEAKQLASKIKNEIMQKENLTCSIGIANNKLIAKIASDFNKPNGLVIVKENENKKFLEPLSIRKLYGVGPKTEFKLKELGIKTIGQLASYNKEKLVNIFGVYGLYLNLSANGHGSDFVAEEYGRLSIGREITFQKDVEDVKTIDNAIEDISNELFDEIKEELYLFRTVSIKARLHDFKTFTRAKTLHCLRKDKESISKTAKKLSREFYGDKIRLIGVRISNLEEFKDQKTIWEYV